MNRRQAMLKFWQFMAAFPLLKLAAWDYLDEGSDDEVSVHGNRTRFDNIIIRPHFLIDDLSAVDTSTTLFGKQLTQPVYISVTGGKNCFFPMANKKPLWPLAACKICHSN